MTGLFVISTLRRRTHSFISASISYSQNVRRFLFSQGHYPVNADPRAVLLNSVLGTLNARKTLREQMSGGVVSIPLPDMSGSAEASADRTSEGGRFHEVSPLGPFNGYDDAMNGEYLLSCRSADPRPLF